MNETKSNEKILKANRSSNISRDVYRVVISKEAKRSLDEFIKKANEGFDAGEITKSDIVNMLLLNAPRYLTDSDIKALRSQHFDEAKVLGALLKSINQGANLPENLRAFLRDHCGLGETQRRKPSTSGIRAVAEEKSSKPTQNFGEDSR